MILPGAALRFHCGTQRVSSSCPGPAARSATRGGLRPHSRLHEGFFISVEIFANTCKVITTCFLFLAPMCARPEHVCSMHFTDCEVSLHIECLLIT